MSENNLFVQFQELPRKDRFSIIQEGRRRLKEDLSLQTPPFSFLSCGSSLYGLNEALNEEELGQFDDIDSTLVLDDTKDLAYGKFIESLQSIFYIPNSEIPSQEEFDHLMSGNGRFRIQGFFRGISVPLHCNPLSLLRRGASPYGVNVKFPIKNPNKPSYTHEPKTDRSIGGMGYDTYLRTYRVAEDDHWIWLDEVFSKRMRDTVTMGILADRFLSSEILYDDTGKVSHLHDQYWSTFVRSSLHFNPAMTNNDIIDTFCRSRRFTQEYRETLSKKITKKREELSSRLTLTKINETRINQPLSLEYIESLPTAEFNTDCFIDKKNGLVIKKRPDTRSAFYVSQFHSMLQNSGLDVGPKPEFQTIPGLGVVEITPYYGDSDGTNVIEKGSNDEARDFFRDVILSAIFKVAKSQRDISNLDFSVDPLPNNFVYDIQTSTWRYIDYYPVEVKHLRTHQKRFDLKKLVNYAIVKTGRGRPELIQDFIDIAIEEVNKAALHEVEEYLISRPYLVAKQYIKEGNIHDLYALIDSLSSKEDVSGCLLLITAAMSDTKLQENFPEASFDRQLLQYRIVEKLSFSTGKASLEEYKESVKKII